MIKKKILEDQKGRRLGIILDYQEYLKLKKIEEDYLVLLSEKKSSENLNLVQEQNDPIEEYTLKI